MAIPMVLQDVPSFVLDRSGCDDDRIDRLSHQHPMFGEKIRGMSVRLGVGLELLCMQMDVSDDVVMGFERDQAFLEFGCLLSGHVRGCSELCNGGKQHFGGGPGQTWFSYFHKARGTIEYLTGQPLCVVVFVVSAPLLDTFLPRNRFGCMSAPGRNKGDLSFNGIGTLTPEVNQIAHQVLKKNDRPDELNRLYLISKAYELLFHLIAGRQGREDTTIPMKYRKCIHRAARILRENLDTPPNLSDIARQAGMCATRLNEGFKKQFGTTVFGFLRQERLSKAKYLMVHENKSASEAAWEVGYASQSSFNRAFYAHYGVTPGFFSKRKE